MPDIPGHESNSSKCSFLDVGQGGPRSNVLRRVSRPEDVLRAEQEACPCEPKIEQFSEPTAFVFLLEKRNETSKAALLSESVAEGSEDSREGKNMLLCSFCKVSPKGDYCRKVCQNHPGQGHPGRMIFKCQDTTVKLGQLYYRSPAHQMEISLVTGTF